MSNDSIKDIMIDCTNLALKLAYEQESIDDEVWGWAADRLHQKYIDDRMSGKCSLQESIDFDLSQVESDLKQTRARFWIMLKPDNLNLSSQENFTAWQNLLQQTFKIEYIKSVHLTIDCLDYANNPLNHTRAF